MLRNKLFNIGLMIVVVIALVGIVFVVCYQMFWKNHTEVQSKHPIPSAQQLAASQYMVDKITTNLQGQSVIQVQFGLQADSEKTKNELEVRKVQVLDTINTILHKTSPDDLKNYDKIKLEIMDAINGFLTTGKITNVYMPVIVLG